MPTRPAPRWARCVGSLREAAPVALEQGAGQAADEELALTQARLEAVLQEMSRQETFMGALAAAEPIVAGVQARGLLHTGRLSATVGKAGDVLEGLIQAQCGGMVANRDALVALQERVMKALTLATWPRSWRPGPARPLACCPSSGRVRAALRRPTCEPGRPGTPGLHLNG